MYEHFNPLDLAGAGWQHGLMLLGALVLGYVIGYTSERGRVTALETELSDLEAAVDDCRQTKAAVPTKPLIPRPEPAPAVPHVPEAVPTDNAFLVTAVLDNAKPDDLTLIEGIGPKIAELLRESGIDTFTGLAATPPNHLTGLLRAAGPSYQIHDPSTWPEQARLAAAGQWEALKAYQATLDAGRS
jgi:predicted flap endonuclease-1-like 5' DNA nuclease